MKRFIVYSCLLAGVACKSSNSKTELQAPPQAALTKSANSARFNQSFERLMAGYYALEEGFVREDAAGIRGSAQNMMGVADSLPLKELRADTNLVATARTYAAGISSELKGLIGENELEGKRKSFQVVSDQLYDLVRTVQYDREVVYHDYCPMAFNDQGANWLSNMRGIRNPYIPKKMITCGELKDSIDFRPKP